MNRIILIFLFVYSGMPFLFSLFKEGFKIGCYKTFKKRVDDVVDMLKTDINELCNNANSISIVTDAWSDASMQSFLGLGAYVESKSFESNIVILGMVQLTNGSRSEQIKEAVEAIINGYTFEKSKIKSKQKE